MFPSEAGTKAEAHAEMAVSLLETVQGESRQEDRVELIAAAQVHATLSVAYATLAI